jgi:peptidyl-prolyl cis-trans isomerase B (cyclophilin B)
MIMKHVLEVIAIPLLFTAALGAVEVKLEQVSPYITAGADAWFRITVYAPDGKGLNAAMLDASCIAIETGEGKTLKPKSEKIPRQALRLGKKATVSREVNLGEALDGLKTQTLEVGWSFGDDQAEPLTVRVYEWDLKAIEAVITTSMGEMTAEFFPEKAPITVMNFVDLSLKGFYDGLTFHRVVPGFMIQGGCPIGDGTGDPGYFIKGEFTDITHSRGTLSMARTADPDSAGCQFFIMHQDNERLDYQYAAFGRLTSGFDVLDEIVEVETTFQRGGQEKSRPVNPPKIEKITIREKPKKKGG